MDSQTDLDLYVPDHRGWREEGCRHRNCKIETSSFVILDYVFTKDTGKILENADVPDAHVVGVHGIVGVLFLQGLECRRVVYII